MLHTLTVNMHITTQTIVNSLHWKKTPFASIHDDSLMISNKIKRLDIRYHCYKHKTVSTLSCLEKFAPDDLRVVWKCEVTASVLEESFIVNVLPMIFPDDCSSETHETGPQVGYNYIQEVTKQDECIFPWLTPSLKTVTIKHLLSTGIERTKRPSFAGEILLLG